MKRRMRIGNHSVYHGKRAFLRDFLIPPRCPGCRKLLKITGRHSPFCGECLEMFEQDLRKPCKECKRAMCECTCLPTLLTENGITEGLVLAAYRQGGYTVAARSVFRMKSDLDPFLFDEFAKRLARRIAHAVRQEGIDPQRVFIVSLPRSRRAVNVNGFDQAHELAWRIAERTGFPYVDCLRRRISGAEQKTLTAEERQRNLSGVFRFKSSVSFEGATVFLIDDIVTSGSGILECAFLLYEAGAVRVIPATLARTIEQ